MRKLASIQRISKLSPIENADNIELARILGWNVVVKGGEFKENDFCVYVEIDSILPDKPEFAFLKNSNGKMQRIRTIKLRGQISQGIAFPLSILKDCSISDKWIDNELVTVVYKDTPESVRRLEEGTDITDIIGVIKYEPSFDGTMSGIIKRNRPWFIPKTDEIRIQSIPHILQKYAGTIMNATEKLDGTSASFYWCENEFGVCSRNLELKDEGNGIYWAIAKKYNLPNMELFGYVLQGEIIGRRIQQNKYKIADIDLYIFQVYNIETCTYLSSSECKELCDTHQLKTAPTILSNIVLNHNVEELIELTKGKSQLNSNIHREGLVFRPISEIKCDDKDLNGRLSFKVVNPEFLLEYKDS